MIKIKSKVVVKVTLNEILCNRNNLVIRNMYAKYESPITKDDQVMTDNKVFQSRSKVMVKLTYSKVMVPSEKPCNKEHM